MDHQPVVEHLVVDAGALIRGEQLHNLAQRFYTCEEILLEIRDKKARRNLEMLPYKLELREPSEESLKQVVEFAKKTGDIASLSKPDIKIIALARTLELENNGLQNVRLTPKGSDNVSEDAKAKALADEEESRNKKVERPTIKPSVLKTGVSWASAIKAPSDDTAAPTTHTTPTPTPANANANASPQDMENCWDEDDFAGANESGDDGEAANDDDVAEVADQMADKLDVNATPNEQLFPALPAPKTPLTPFEVPTVIAWGSTAADKDGDASEEAQTASDPEQEQPEPETSQPKSSTSRIIGVGSSLASHFNPEDDDGEGWADAKTVSTMGEQAGWLGEKPTSKKKDMFKSDSNVACITTDYAMQNVMLQMRLRLVTLDGRAVTRIKHWVLKCDGCYKICRNLDKKFCPSCGNATLAKLSYSINENGDLFYHFKKNRRVNTRGTKFSLAMPKGGRQGDLLLREDQLMMGVWQQRSKQKKANTSIFGEDVTDSLGLSLSRQGSEIQVGFGRRNPNAMKGRERRGKKKKGAKR